MVTGEFHVRMEKEIEKTVAIEKMKGGGGGITLIRKGNRTWND